MRFETKVLKQAFKDFNQEVFKSFTKVWKRSKQKIL